ncbi:MAG: uroporphyrinogen decarboxylase family protein [Chloroflexota bacterium]
MDVRERILTALTWGEPDRVPLTTYARMLPQGAGERLARNLGVGLVYRPPAHVESHREAEVISREYWENGERRLRKTIKTPVGEIWQTLRAEGAYGTSTWIVEHFLKGPDDYKVMEFYINDAVYKDNYAEIGELRRRVAGDGLVYVRIHKTPLQEMLYFMLGMERFALDFYERRDLFDSLFHTMCRRYEELFVLAAAAPVELVLMGDNISGDVVSRERFRDYIAPLYKRIREAVSGTGKLIGAHMDGRLGALKGEIATADLDVIEALTPPPMGNVSLNEAREIWPRKAQWINFTSSMHIAEPEEIADHTRQLLADWGDKRGLAIGVTEDAPVEALERSLATIARVLEDY